MVAVNKAFALRMMNACILIRENCREGIRENGRAV